MEEAAASDGGQPMTALDRQAEAGHDWSKHRGSPRFYEQRVDEKALSDSSRPSRVQRFDAIPGNFEDNDWDCATFCRKHSLKILFDRAFADGEIRAEVEINLYGR